MDIKNMRFVNPATGREVNYWRAKYLGIIPADLLAQDTKQSVPDEEDVEPETVRISDLAFDQRMFVPLKTGNTNLDRFVSSHGGFMPATNIIIIGSPGIGKTSVALNMLARVKKGGKRVLFISGEMNRIDMYRYAKRFKNISDIDILFLSDYADKNPKLAIEKQLAKGYDMVLIDSWAEVCETVKEYTGWSEKKAQSWVLDLMEKHNEGNNDEKLYTCFTVIQQVTKAGKFLGSNRLKHMTSAMLDMYHDRDNNRNIMEFSKNRVGTAGQQVGFAIQNGSINYTRVNN